MSNFELFLVNHGISFFYFKLVLGFAFSFLITFLAIPAIIKISRRKNLMDEPGARSSHLRKIPNLGGIAVFFSLGVCAPIFAYELFDRYKFLFASLIILFFVGIMDDIMVLRAYKKLLAQILVSALMVVGSDVRIRSLFGVFGVYEINYYASVIFSILTFIILINAFNLIDGIDGLAGSYTVATSALFGISFFRLGEHNDPLVILCAILIAASLGFLYYNLSNKRSTKIFMGDTGSMFLGFMLAGISVLGTVKSAATIALIVPVVAMGLPILDTAFAIIRRYTNGQPIFKPDKGHLHHRLLARGYTARRVLLVLYSVSILLGAMAVALTKWRG